jgi:hypothetical protein
MVEDTGTGALRNIKLVTFNEAIAIFLRTMLSTWELDDGLHTGPG